MSNYQVDRERWAQLSIFEQMGNVGSEVGRAISSWRAGKKDYAQGAIDRGLDLLDATAEVWARQKSPRTREILRARECFVALFYGGSFDQDADALERYFMQFALAARNGR